MTRLMQQALATVRSWPDARQDEAALDRLGPAACQATDEELDAIDEALAQVERGELATDADVEAAFARFRK